MVSGRRKSSLQQGVFVGRQGIVLVAAAVLVGAFSACTRTAVQSPPVIGNSTGSAAAGNVTGAGSSRAAVESFLVAVKSSDLQAMSGVWGTRKGPARDLMKREELEKRLVVMQCLLMHDKWRFVEDSPRLQTAGHQQWQIELTRKSSVAKTTVNTVPGPGGRWFLEDVDVLPLKDFCR